MLRFHIHRNLRSLLFILATTAIIGCVVLVWWANRVGMPKPWRTAIEAAIAKQGIHMSIGSLRYTPLRGVSASHIRVFGDAEHTHEISRLEHIILDFDKTKLARGIVQLIKIDLHNATLSLPIDPEQPDGEALHIDHANGTLLMPGSRRLEIRHATGNIAGIEVEIDARLIGYQQTGPPSTDPDTSGQRRQLIANILEKLEQWRFDNQEPPKIRAFVEYDINDHDSLRARISLTSPKIERNGQALTGISASALIEGNRLTVEHLTANDAHGALEANIDFDMGSRHCRFDTHSSLDALRLLEKWGHAPPAALLSIEGKQDILATGDLTLDHGGVTDLNVTGQADLTGLIHKTVRFSKVSTSFAIQDKKIFLQDILLTRNDGTLKGKALIQPPQVRIALDSTLPAATYAPLFVGQPLAIVIKNFAENENSTLKLHLDGSFDTSDRHNWNYTGHGTATHISYNGVPVRAATCQLALSHDMLDFHDGSVVYNYSQYPLRKAFGGPTTATSQVKRVRYVAATKLVEIEQVTGAFWVAPLVRFFNPKIADNLEAYRFHTPPQLSGHGVVDTTPQGRTKLDITFASDTAATYKFLGQDITLTAPKGAVAIHGESVLVKNLTATTFGGPTRSDITVVGGKRISGEITWNDISVAELGKTYQFGMENGGKTTGRIEFSMLSEKTRTMQGKGLIAVSDAELFSVPMFGPLSKVIATVLGDRRSGFERAKSAFCTFDIKDGILSSNDFHTSTRSLIFAGDGSVDLSDRTFEMTMRMNARGLLGLITLPLKPFYGMFQFRGTGPLSKPTWKNVMFTSPPKAAQELLEAPKAEIAE